MIIKLNKNHAIGINKSKNIVFDLNEEQYKKYLIDDSSDILVIDEVFNHSITTFKLQHMQTIKDTLIFNIISEEVNIDNNCVTY